MARTRRATLALLVALSAWPNATLAQTPPGPATINAQTPTTPPVAPARGGEVTLEGEWHNRLPRGVVVEHVVVSWGTKGWTAQLWSACKECDWGERPLKPRGSTNQTTITRAAAEWPRGFVTSARGTTTTVDFTLDHDVLRLNFRTVSVSGSQRATSTAVEEFVRVVPPTTGGPSSETPSSRPPASASVAAVGAGVQQPQAVRQVNPSYPLPAMRARVEGTVIVQGIVQLDGTLSDARVVRSVDQKYGLDEEALKTARQWIFAPGTKDGQPVPMPVTISIDFRIRNSRP